MAICKRRVYIVSLTLEGRKAYYVRQSASFKQEGDHVLSEPMGIFSHDLMDARKFLDRADAEWAASYFDGAGVECIKEGERLK